MGLVEHAERGNDSGGGYRKAIEALEDEGRFRLWLQAEGGDRPLYASTVEMVVKYLRALEGDVDDD